jgi:hypothetical protein
MHYILSFIAAITRRTNEWVCLPASELLPLHRPAQQLGRCGRVICAFSSSPSVFLRCHEEGHGFVGTPHACFRGRRGRRLFGRRTPRRFLMQTGRTTGGLAPPRPLWQLDEVHIDPVQVSPTSTSPVLFMFCREADSACLPQLWSSERFIL